MTSNTSISPQLPLLPQRKDYSPIGVVKILQEKELISELPSARSMESRRTISQTEQTERESRDVEELRHVPESMMTVSSTREQTNQVGARLSDCETNTTVVEIRLSRDEDIIQTHNQGIQVPSSSGGLSSHSMYMEESIVRSNMPNIMLQLDGPTSV